MLLNFSSRDLLQLTKTIASDNAYVESLFHSGIY